MIDPFYSVRYAEEIDSTNLWIKRLHEEGAPEGTTAVADCQTAGRGRRGRSWISPKGESIPFSILLKPSVPPERTPMLSPVMGLAVCDALSEITGKQAQIKWPNDVVISGKKICGILTELIMENDEEPYVIIGTGINNGSREFPEELKDRATSILLETGRKADRGEVLEKVLNIFLADYRQFLRDGDLQSLAGRYNRELINRDREVLITGKDMTVRATARGIDRTGALIIEKEDGTTEAVSSGEVSVRGLYGYT